jgi:hypothetical protein
MSLPNQWIDRIFEKLGLVYGQEFLSRWKGLPIADVKADWAHELAGFENHPEAVAWALRNLPPDRPPTVLQFRNLGRSAPAPDRPMLPEPVADAPRARAELAKLAAYLRTAPKAGPTDWAHKIVAKHRAGGRVTAATLRMARDVASRHPKESDGLESRGEDADRV